MLVTTYQHDYVPPFTKRYEFLKKHKAVKGADNKDAAGDGTEKVECQCMEEARVETPKAVLDQCAAVEWTGIAPMGRLIEPRIIPTKFAPSQVEGMANDANIDCFKEQPNRFLRILRTAYPDLYERLKQLPKDELNRRIDRQRLFTTYQIDFGQLNEYPEGVYDSLKPADESANASKKLLQRQGPCSEFRTNVMKELERENADGFDGNRDPCEKAYKPFKISFTDSSRFISSGGNSHWRATMFTKRANFSEYMDTINKQGCVIMRNNIHNHSKCMKGMHCLHKLTHQCVNLK